MTTGRPKPTATTPASCSTLPSGCTPNRTATANRHATEAEFSIYPNPSTDAFFISGNVLPIEIRCQDILGKQFAIASTAAHAGAVRVDAAGLAPSLYVLSQRLPDWQALTRRIARQ